jgi:hypothetical protein
MNKRAEERREKRRELEEMAKKQQEEKKVSSHLCFELIVRKKQVEEEEQKKAEELKAFQRAQIKQRQLEREKLEHKRLEMKKEKEFVQRSTMLASNHSALAVKRYYGFLPWRKLIQTLHENSKKAAEFNKQQMLKQSLKKWRNNVSDILLEKVLRAQKVYEKILLRQGMRAFLAVPRLPLK